MEPQDPRTTSARRRYRAQAAQSRGPCQLCGEPIDYTLKSPHPRSFEAHHLHAIGNGGPVDGPTVPTHKRCNQRAGTGPVPIPHSQDW